LQRLSYYCYSLLCTLIIIVFSALINIWINLINNSVSPSEEAKPVTSTIQRPLWGHVCSSAKLALFSSGFNSISAASEYWANVNSDPRSALWKALGSHVKWATERGEAWKAINTKRTCCSLLPRASLGIHLPITKTYEVRKSSSQNENYYKSPNSWF